MRWWERSADTGINGRRKLSKSELNLRNSVKSTPRPLSVFTMKPIFKNPIGGFERAAHYHFCPICLESFEHPSRSNLSCGMEYAEYCNFHYINRMYGKDEPDHIPSSPGLCQMNPFDKDDWILIYSEDDNRI